MTGRTAQSWAGHEAQAPDEPTHADAVAGGDERDLALVERLLASAEIAPNDDDAAAHLCAAARVFEGPLGDRERAWLVLTDALGRAPDDEGVLAELERVAERDGRWAELLSATERALMAVDEPASVAKLWARMATWARRLGRIDQAMAAAESALRLDARQPVALAELEECHRAAGRWGELARLLADRARSASMRGTRGRGELLDVQLQLAAIHEEKLGDDEQAMACCQRALAIDHGNVAALARLERLADRHGRSLVLIDVLERRMLRAGDTRELVALALRASAEWEELRRPDRARGLLRELFARGIDDAALATELARLARKARDWATLADVLERRRATADTSDRAEATLELAELLSDRLGRADDAERLLEELSLADPSNAVVASRLAQALGRRADWARLAALHERVGAAAADPAVAGAALADAAQLHRDRLGDEQAAAKLFERALVVSPAHPLAVAEAVRSARERGRWHEVRAVLEAALAAGPDVRPAIRARWHHGLATALERLGRGEAALAEHRRAVALAPHDVECALALGHALYDRGHLVDAAPVLEAVWGREHPLSDDDRGALALRLGRARMAAGQARKAIAAFEAAIATRPHDEAILRALAEACAAAGDWSAAARWQRALMRGGATPAVRAEAAVALAGTLAAHGSAEQAERALREARVLAPGSRAVLHRLLELYTAAGRWRRAVDTLLELAQHEGDPSMRARYLATAGTILRDELRAPLKAIELYNRALDEQPDDYATFARLDRVVCQRRDVREQERAYRMMLWRLRSHRDERARAAQRLLWRGLARLYAGPLHDYRAAKTALEALQRLEPHAPEHREALAEALELCGPNERGRAIALRIDLVASAADLAEAAKHLHALRRLARAAGERERELWVARALVAIGADEDEERAVARRAREPLPLPPAALTSAAWRAIEQGDADRRLADALAPVGRALLALRGRSRRRWGLGRTSRADRARVASSVLGRLVADLTIALGVAAPQVEFCPELEGGLHLASLRERRASRPLLVAGADMLAARPRRELASLVAKRLALLSPERVLLWPTVVPGAGELATVGLALRRLVDPRLDLPARDAAVVRPLERALRRALGPADLERLATVASELAAGPDRLLAWARATFLAANRTAFALAGDLTVVLRTIEREHVGAFAVEPWEQIRDLLAFAVSDGHLALRASAG